MEDKKEISEKVIKYLEKYEEKVTKKIKDELDKKYCFEKRAILDKEHIWANKKPRENRVIIEYLITGIGNRQIEISFKDAHKLSQIIERIVHKRR